MNTPLIADPVAGTDGAMHEAQCLHDHHPLSIAPCTMGSAQGSRPLPRQPQTPWGTAPMVHFMCFAHFERRPAVQTSSWVQPSFPTPDSQIHQTYIRTFVH